MIRSSSRARIRERGFVLLSAIVLAVLYFGLMMLLLIDSSRELHEAQRFRSRIVAAAVAENAAEAMAYGMVTGPRASIAEEDAQGVMGATFVSNAQGFVIDAGGRTKGVMPQNATVRVQGRVTGGQISIDYTVHSQ